MLFLLLLSAAGPTSTDSPSLSEQISGISQTFIGEGGIREGIFREISLRKLVNDEKELGIKKFETEYMASGVQGVFNPTATDGSLVDQIRALTAQVAALKDAVIAFMAQTRQGGQDLSRCIEWSVKRSAKFNATLQNELDVARQIVNIKQAIDTAKENSDWQDINNTLDAIKGTGQTQLTTNAILDINSLIARRLLDVNQKDREEFEKQKARAEKEKEQVERALRANQAAKAASVAKREGETAQEKAAKIALEKRLDQELASIDVALKQKEADLESWQIKLDKSERERRRVLMSQYEDKMKTAKRQLIDKATVLFGQGEQTHRKIVAYATEIDQFNRAFELNKMDTENKKKATLRMLVILNHIGDKVIQKMEEDFKTEQKKVKTQSKEKGKGLLHRLFSEAEIEASKVKNGLLTHLTQDTGKVVEFFTKQPETPKTKKDDAKISKEEERTNKERAREDWENERFERLLPKVSAHVNGAFEKFCTRMLDKSRKVLADDKLCKKYDKESIDSLRVVVAEIDRIQKELGTLRG